MNNYMVFNDADGIYAYTYEQEKKVPFLLKFLFESFLDKIFISSMLLKVEFKYQGLKKQQTRKNIKQKD